MHKGVFRNKRSEEEDAFFYVDIALTRARQSVEKLFRSLKILVSLSCSLFLSIEYLSFLSHDGLVFAIFAGGIKGGRGRGGSGGGVLLKIQEEGVGGTTLFDFFCENGATILFFSTPFVCC